MDPGSARTRAAIYAVASGEESTGRIPELRRFCHGRGWEICREYIDTVDTGTRRGPQQEGLLQGARLGRFTVVVFWELASLASGDLEDTLTFLDELISMGLDFASLRAPLLNSHQPSRDSLAALISGLAGLQKEERRRRITMGLSRARSEGKRLGRPPRTYPADASRIASERAQGASWASLCRKYGIPRTSLRRHFCKGRAELDAAGQGEKV